MGLLVGEIVMLPFSSLPNNMLVCDGSELSRTTYAALFAAIGDIYGGDGANTFKIPDDRGRFVRFQDSGAGRDPDRASRTNRGDGVTGDNVGTNQSQRFGSHNHAHLGSTGTGVSTTAYMPVCAAFTVTRTTGYNGGINTSTETRPLNIALVGAIRYE